jgi:hypothetical protein
MFTHRFDGQLLSQDLSPRNVGFLAFMPMPITSPGADWLQWLYLKAFEEAAKEVQAENRALRLRESLN